MYEDKIYYEDQTAWSPADFYALWRYLNRLNQHIGPSSTLTAALANIETLPEREQARVSRVARLQEKRTGTRDDELSALDLARMSAETRYLLKHMLIHENRYELALERFPNLRGLDEIGDLGHPIILDEKPRGTYEYYTEKGIFL